MKNQKLDLKALAVQFKAFSAKLNHYAFLTFLVVVVAIYGFVLYRINSLRNVQPTDMAVSSQVKAARVPRIDEKVAGQLKSLQDNSVSVKALFEEARSNPF